MKDKIPKLLKDSIENNHYDIDIITKTLKLPWLKLDIKFEEPQDADLQQIYSNSDWRKKWKFPFLHDNAYQVNQWNGDIFFGPQDWKQFLELNEKEQKHFEHDEDSKCRMFRQKVKYDWYVEDNHYIKQQIKRYIKNDEDLNLVNSYTLPPGGYLFPHRDYAMDGMGLAKIYVALQWDAGNVFGMYGCGNIPIRQGDVFLINNYTLPHWVYNGSNKTRVVIDISANLHSPTIKQEIVSAFKKSLQVDF